MISKSSRDPLRNALKSVLELYRDLLGEKVLREMLDEVLGPPKVEIRNEP